MAAAAILDLPNVITSAWIDFWLKFELRIPWHSVREKRVKQRKKTLKVMFS